MTKGLRVLLAVVLLAASLPLHAQESLEIKTPERIARMLESMPMSVVPQSGQFRCPELSSTVMFYTQSDNGITEQLGALLFSDGIRKSYDPVIISFVERLWVELLLRKTTSSQNSLLKEYGVRIVLGGYPLGSGSFNSLDKALNVINALSSVQITTGGNEIDMFMRDTTDATLHIYIPASRDLLFQFDKKEHEERLINELASNRSTYRQSLPESNSFSRTDNGLLAIGGDCYMIDSLRNDVFYTSDRKLLWDPAQYPEESMRNILMGAAAPGHLLGITLNVTPHTYNREIKKFKIPMNLLLGYLQQQGFRFYTGDMGRDGDRCQCLLAMFHPVYNYLHILSLSFTPEQLNGNSEVTLKADLSTFIPQHNIKNLFQEK
ncbi:MAG: hypothetical protein IKM90_06650 [Bacteroidaceae bacterium]|jgi:hypothetical protein|nr:hypothetical protein [Bacteroidaceae bacterium]